jgi:hypothetical protein
VRIEFCEADILELFDDWRRAIGAGTGSPGDSDHGRRESLPAHLDRTIARLTALRAGGSQSTAFDQRLESTVRELDVMRGRARQVRGDARTVLLEQLAALDKGLIDAASDELRDRRPDLERAAQAEIAPFATRMTEEARAAAVRAALDRVIRDALGLPVIALD